MANYEQQKNERMFNLLYAAYQDRSTLIASLLSTGCQSDKEIALEVAVEVRDLIRMDKNLKLGVFHDDNHVNLIESYTPPRLFE